MKLQEVVMPQSTDELTSSNDGKLAERYSKHGTYIQNELENGSGCFM